VDIFPVMEGLFNVVGLPDNAVRERRERIRAFLRNGGFDFPAQRAFCGFPKMYEFRERRFLPRIGCFRGYYPVRGSFRDDLRAWPLECVCPWRMIAEVPGG
jgi:hypothetical protein